MADVKGAVIGQEEVGLMTFIAYEVSTLLMTKDPKNALTARVKRQISEICFISVQDVMIIR